MIHGDTSATFAPLRALFRKLLSKYDRGGGALSVYHNGESVVDVWGGTRDACGSPWERGTLCVSYSTTKGIMATAMHMLADRGLLDYDQRVAHYWPEFAQAGKGAMTVRDVMCHRSGLFDVRSLIDDATELMDWERMTAALAAASPQPPPAGSSAYQALTWGHLVGEVLRRITGTHVPEFVRREIAEPLGLEGFYVGAPQDAIARAARLIRGAEVPGANDGSQRGNTAKARARKRQQRLYRGGAAVLRRLGHPVDLDRAGAALAPRGISRFDFSSEAALRACIPAANGLFSARSLARFYAALAAGGSLGGTRLLSSAALSRATEIQSTGYDQVILFKMRWRLGYHRVSTLRGVAPHAFGHFGWGGSGAWADPAHNLSFGFVVNRGAGTPIGDLRITRLTSAAYACAKRLR